MAKRTAKSRHHAIIELYGSHVCKQPFTAEMLARWAMDNELMPAPSMHSSEEEAAAWEKRFEAVKTAIVKK